MHLKSTRRVCTAVVAVLGMVGVSIAVAPAASAAAKGNVSIASTLPRWLAHATKNEFTTFALAPMSIRVYLTPKGGSAALAAKAQAVSDPKSKEFGHFLSVAQYNAAYEPTQAQVDSVSKYLTSKGLTVTGVEASRRYITATGDTSSLGQAFNVSLQSYNHDGQSVTAPSTAASVPADIAASVLTVSGLDTTVYKKGTDHIASDAPAPPPAFVNARPCSITYGQVLATFKADFKTPLPKFQGQVLPYAPCGYTGPFLRAAYENNTSLTGTGETVAITDAYASAFLASDASTYAANHGDGGYIKGQLTQVLPKSFNSEALCDASGWAAEEMLDVEAVHAMAPTANIRYYASASCFDDDFLTTLARVVDDNKAKVVSNSWGDTEANESSANIAAYEQVFIQGALQGISFMFSSGDNGDELQNTAIKQADYPASDPYITSVGGTSTEIDRTGAIANQTGWGTVKYNLSADGKSWVLQGFTSGAGGGFSALFNRPDYQNGKVPVSAPPGRAVPDVAMDADPNTGMLIGHTQTFPDSVHYGEYRIGGTSLASPLMAGYTAIALQKNKSRGFGLMNPVLYNAKSLFTDVKPIADLGVVRADYANALNPSAGILYSVRLFGRDSSLAVAPGWDPVTGLGVPKGKFLVPDPAPATGGTAPTGGNVGGPAS